MHTFLTITYSQAVPDFAGFCSLLYLQILMFRQFYLYGCFIYLCEGSLVKKGFIMNLMVSSVSTQIPASQNISSKGRFSKFFGINKKPAKDVFVAAATTAAAATAGAAAANQVQNSKNDEAMREVFVNLRFMHSKASLRDNSFEKLINNINENLNKFPQDSTKDFISDVMGCISNALEKNPKELCSIHEFGNGRMMGNAGAFLLKTGQNLIRLKTNAEDAANKNFVEQVQKDVQTSKNLMQLINNGDWESVRKINLDSNIMKYL